MLLRLVVATALVALVLGGGGGGGGYGGEGCEHKNCWECKHSTHCGWCSATSKCVGGNEEKPFDEGCCPAGLYDFTPKCKHCGHLSCQEVGKVPNCGWCATRLEAIPGGEWGAEEDLRKAGGANGPRPNGPNKPSKPAAPTEEKAAVAGGGGGGGCCDAYVFTPKCDDLAYCKYLTWDQCRESPRCGACHSSNACIPGDAQGPLDGLSCSHYDFHCDFGKGGVPPPP